MNWGKKLIIGMALFMIFIACLGAIMIMQGGSDALVENDYYEKGQKYDKDYNARQDAINDMVVPAITTNEYGLTITFPSPVKYQIVCRRSSDYQMDRLFSGYTDADRSIEITEGELQPGPWLLRIQYTANDKNYLFEAEIIMP